MRLNHGTMAATLALCAHLAILVLTALITNTCAAPITCEAGTYVVGKPASVTCNFRTYVHSTEKSFNMARYPPDAKKGAIGTDVLLCHWSADTKKHDCHVSDGYTFNDVITDRVTVGIQNASDIHEGLYMCFFVPAERDTHACEFVVTAQSLSSDNSTDPNKPQKQDDKAKDIGIIVGLIVLAIVICCLLVFLYKRRRKMKSKDKANKPLIPPRSKEIRQRLKCLELPKELNKVMDVVQQEIHRGLDRATRQPTDESPQPEADLKMYPMSLGSVLGLGIVGDYLVVDFRAKRVTVFDIRFRRRGVLKIPSKCYPVMPDIRTCDQLFTFIVESVDSFVQEVIPDAEKRNAVLIVPFPCEHKCPEKATLVKWTQEFCCERVPDEDLRDLLRKASNAKSIGKKVKFVAIVNDVVSTVVSVAHQNPDCRIGLVVGGGLNACYVQKWLHVTDDNSSGQDNTTMYNTEVGALGENHCLEEFRTDYDRELDNSSSAPGNQTLEKMVSWTYIGELVRLVLKDLRKNKLLLKSVPLECQLFPEGCLTADHVAEIDSETEINISSVPEARSDTKRNSDVPGNTGADKRSSAEGNNDEEKARTPTERILRELGADQFTEEDLNTVRNVCRIVIDRAAHLVGTVLASLVNHHNQPGVVIVVDGELFRKVPRFHGLLFQTGNRLVKSELKDKFYLVSSFRRGNIGAARIAAASVRQNQAAGT